VKNNQPYQTMKIQNYVSNTALLLYKVVKKFNLIKNFIYSTIMFYFTASYDDTEADKNYIGPTADDSNKFKNGNYNLEESDNVVEYTNYSLVGMYLFLINLIFVYILMLCIQFIKMFMLLSIYI